MEYGIIIDYDEMAKAIAPQIINDFASNSMAASFNLYTTNLLTNWQ
jgi:hypothetical protein